MIKYSTLEDTSNKVLFKAFMQSFEGFRITTETTYESFSEMLVERNYDPTISIGAFDTETGKLVSYVLNSINETDKKTSYDILTGTIPDYRRRGISKTIFEKMKTLLQQKGVQLYKTEVLKTNAGALALYLSVGFAVKNEVVSVIKTPKGSREVYEYEIVMNIYGGKGMKLTLVRPTLEMKELALDYRKEHFDNNEMIINGSELLDKTDSYEEWLKSVTDNTSPDTVSPNWVVTDTFFAVDENGKKSGCQ